MGGGSRNPNRNLLYQCSHIGAEAQCPSVEVKGTGNGHREGGWTAFDIFTIENSLFDYSDKLQRHKLIIINTYQLRVFGR